MPSLAGARDRFRSMWMLLALQVPPRPADDDAVGAHLRRHRSARPNRGPSSPGAGLEGLGPRRTASPAPATAPAIAGLVLDALRRRASLAWLMDETARALLLGMLALQRWCWPLDDRRACFAGERFAPRAADATPNARRSRRRRARRCAGAMSQGDYAGLALAGLRAVPLAMTASPKPGPGRPRAGRPAGQHAEDRPATGPRRAGAARRQADAAARRSACVSPPLADGRGGLRGGRAVASPRAGSRCRTRARRSPRCLAGDAQGKQVARPLRRRRRQDAGARRRDGQHGPDLRLRHRHAAARADP